MQANVNGVRLVWSERGRKHPTTLLLIHGFPLDRRMWDAQLAGLSKVARVVAPDLRGHGESEVPPGPYTMEQHADDLAALLDRLGIERAIVAGLSMGGYVAFALWRRHAERIQALALLDTRAEPDSPTAKATRDAAIVKVREAGSEAFAREMLPRLLAPQSLANARLAGKALRIMAAQPVEGIVGALAGMRDRADSRPTLPSITVPALVVTGEKDAVTPPAVGGEMAAALPHARAVVVPGAGHLSPIEKPRAVNAALRAFVAHAAA